MSRHRRQQKRRARRSSYAAVLRDGVVLIYDQRTGEKKAMMPESVYLSLRGNGA